VKDAIISSFHTRDHLVYFLFLRKCSVGTFQVKFFFFQSLLWSWKLLMQTFLTICHKAFWTSWN